MEKFDRSWFSELSELFNEGAEEKVNHQLTMATNEYIGCQHELEELALRIKGIDSTENDLVRFEKLLQLVVEQGSEVDLVDLLTRNKQIRIEDLPQLQKDAVAMQALMNLIAMSWDHLAKRMRNTVAKVKLEESYIPEGTPTAMNEALVRANGEVWEVHKTDADRYPSDPHAHNYNENMKLDFRNGDLWRGSRFLNKSMKAKHLEHLRNEFEQKGVVLPTLDYSTSKKTA